MVIVFFDIGSLLSRVDFQTQYFFVGHQQLVNLAAIATPNFCWDLDRFRCVVGVSDAEDNRHHQAANITKACDVKIGFATQQRALFVVQPVQEFLVRLAVGLFDLFRIVVFAVVKIF